MRLADYLVALDESESAFARRAGLPQRTVNGVISSGNCTARTALKIIEASKDRPAPGGRIVMLEDLVIDENGDDAGAAA